MTIPVPPDFRRDFRGKSRPSHFRLNGKSEPRRRNRRPRRGSPIDISGFSEERSKSCRFFKSFSDNFPGTTFVRFFPKHRKFAGQDRRSEDRHGAGNCLTARRDCPGKSFIAYGVCDLFIEEPLLMLLDFRRMRWEKLLFLITGNTSGGKSGNKRPRTNAFRSDIRIFPRSGNSLTPPPSPPIIITCKIYLITSHANK